MFYAAPTAVIVVVFFLVPLVLVFWMSANRWRILGSPTFNFPDNYTKIPDNQLFLDSVTFTLTFTEITIDDAIAVERLRQLKSISQPTFRFVGEVFRPDGSTGRYICDKCVPDGTFRLAASNPGDTMTRDHSYRVLEVPDIDAALGS